MSAIIPIPKIPIVVRAGTMDDLPFIDALQKKHPKQVGFMANKQFEGKIKAGHVLVAEEKIEDRGLKVEESACAPSPSSIFHPPSSPLGYLIGNDQYFKRDDVGIIYQIN